MLSQVMLMLPSLSWVFLPSRSSCVYKMELRLPLQQINEHHLSQGQAEIKPYIYSPASNICLRLRVYQIWGPVIGKGPCLLDVPHQC